MRTARLALILALGCVLATAAAAQAQKQKLYRWVDKDGKVHYSDALPPEAVDRARRELSATSGMTVDTVERALTDAERDALSAEQAEALAAKRSAAEQAERDQMLLGSYPSEKDIERAYQERIALLEESLKASQVAIEGQRQSLASLLASAADRELSGQPVDARTVATVRETHRQIALQREQLQRHEIQRAALQQEFESTLARYRELRAEQDAKAG